MSDVKMIILDGAGNVICQHVEVKGDWVVVQTQSCVLITKKKIV